MITRHAQTCIKATLQLHLTRARRAQDVANDLIVKKFPHHFPVLLPFLRHLLPLLLQLHPPLDPLLLPHPLHCMHFDVALQEQPQCQFTYS
jgi:hypothetical protein